MMEPEVESTWADDDWQTRHELVYKCQLGMLYHRKRERFLALLDKWSTALALIAGSSAMTDLLPSPVAKSIAGALVAAVTLPALVFGWADKSRLHTLLAAKFISLEAKIEGAGVLRARDLNALKAEALLIEMEEPPQFSALTRICQNELAAASGDRSHMTEVTHFTRLMAQFFDMPVKMRRHEMKLNP